MATDGKARALAQSTRDATASIVLRSVAHAWNVAGNVTGITLNSSVASTFAIGSSMKVWALN